MTVQALQPRDQLVAIMNRIYQGGMTTLSGGNLSIKDGDGDRWITPAGMDKGRLTARDMVCIRADGRVIGPRSPSSEYPFHQAIYRARPDLKAIAHAHPPALVAFSITRIIPDTSLLPRIQRICGPISYAPYALTGSEELGQAIAATFAAGYNVVMLENHGVVTAGESLFEAFQRLEALDFCARILIGAQTIGGNTLLNAKTNKLPDQPSTQPAELGLSSRGYLKRELRLQLADIARRAYSRQLMLSTSGDISARFSESSFLITPAGKDRHHLATEDFVLVTTDGRHESGKKPGKSVGLHQAIYARHANAQAVIFAQPPDATAFAITDASFDTRTIPECYIMLRDIPRLPSPDPETVSAVNFNRSPVVLIENEGVLVTGKDLVQALDRLEVAEYSARSLIATAAIGPLKPIGEADLHKLREKFGLS
ncbi:MAG: class II aldolase/adducin family protein [Chloroflexota bacterium]|jgi:L-fuculose-phosphate aldolase